MRYAIIIGSHSTRARAHAAKGQTRYSHTQWWDVTDARPPFITDKSFRPNLHRIADMSRYTIVNRVP
jgi:hypothetical protein